MTTFPTPNNICDIKMNQNSESTNSMMSVAAQRVEVRLTHSSEVGKILNSIEDIKISKD